MGFQSLEPQTPMRMPAANAYAATALARSEAAAARCRGEFDLSYGPDPKHRLDLYLPAKAGRPAPVLIFLHGGSWTHGYKEWMGFMAPALIDVPAIFVAANYRLVPTHRFPAQVDDTLAVLAWVHREIGRYGGDRGRVFLGGHSAGGHLAAMATLQHEFWRERGLPADPLRGCVAISTTFDYRETPEDAGNFLARPEDAAAASPIAHVAGNRVPFLIAWGGEDFERARRTSETMASALKSAGGEANELVIPGADHFAMSLDLGDAAHPLTRTVRAFIGAGDPH